MTFDFSLTLDAPARAATAAAPATERDISKARALVVDGQPTSRSLLMAQLRDIGIGTIKHVSAPSDARPLLERANYDFVFCESSFPDPDESGQDLLDELRREHLLPYSTVFIMVTAEADYAKVREAAESVVDAYLLRPYSSQRLTERVLECRRRKLSLADVFLAHESGQNERAVTLALARVQQRAPYWSVCARLAAELLIQTERLDEATALLQELADNADQPWAKLGLVRVQAARGEGNNARRNAEALVTERPDYADAFDVLGRLQVDQGDLGAALETYRTASRLTPGCLLRLQHTGTLAFYTGAAEESIRCLDRVVALGLDSRLFDALTLMLLALAKHDTAQTRGVALAHEQLRRFLQRHPGSGRLRRMELAVGVLVALCMEQAAEAATSLSRLAAEHQADSFDVEAATILLALLARVPAAMANQIDSTALVRAVALRCCVSRVVTEVLVTSVGTDTAFTGILRDAHAEIHGVAERAVAMSAGNRPREAVNLLLEHGRSTLNAKLIDMAAMIAIRHKAGLQDADTLLEMIGMLQGRYCRPVTHLAGVMRSRRAPGAMALRTAAHRTPSGA